MPLFYLWLYIQMIKPILNFFIATHNKIKTQCYNLLKSVFFFKKKIAPKLNTLYMLMKRIFNKHNFTKVLIVFMIGFSIRLYINIYHDINVFVDFLTMTSLTYYLFISCFAIVVHECVTLFGFSIFPSSLCHSFNFIFSYISASIYNREAKTGIEYYSLFSHANLKIKSLYNNFNLSYFYSCYDVFKAQDNKLSFIRNFFKDWLVWFRHEWKSMFFTLPYYEEGKNTPTNNSDSSVHSQGEKDSKAYALFKNNKGKGKEITSNDTETSISNKESLAIRSKHKGEVSAKEKSTASTENKIKATYIKSENVNPRYPSRIFFGDNHEYDGDSAIFNISEENSSNSNSTNGNYETLPPTVYKAQYNVESGQSSNESLRHNGESSRHNGKPLVYNDFQLYGEEASNYNTPSTMTPMFPSREASIYKNEDTRVNTQDNIIPGDRTSLKFDDPTISHPLFTNNRNLNVNSVNWEDRRLQVKNGFKDGIAGYSDKVVVDETRIEKTGLRGKVKLGIKSLGNAFGQNRDSDKTSIYLKFHDKAKRKFMWVIWEGSRGDYESYRDFKKSFDPNTKIFSKIWTTIKSDLSSEIEDLIKAKNVFKIDSSSSMYKNIKLDPSKRAEYFAHLSESKSHAAAYEVRPKHKNKVAFNTTNTHKDLMEESERKYKSERKHKSRHTSSRAKQENETIYSSTPNNEGEVRQDNPSKHRHRHRHHGNSSHHRHGHNHSHSSRHNRSHHHHSSSHREDV